MNSREILTKMEGVAASFAEAHQLDKDASALLRKAYAKRRRANTIRRAALRNHGTLHAEFRNALTVAEARKEIEQSRASIS